MDKKFEVSQLFLDIFKLLNVSDQKERMKELNPKELYFLLICCMDYHDEEDSQVIDNLSDFETEIKEILQFQETEKTNNPYLLELVKDTEDAYITTANSDLPHIYTKEEVRDLKIKGLLD